MTAAAHGEGTVVPRTRVAKRTLTSSTAARYVLGGLRIAMGWIFLWAFLDKLFGLGHDTASKDAWINGGSPTMGFLKFGAKGPFTDFYHSIAGAGWADWLFMIGLAGIGLALITGIFMRIGTIAGVVLLLMMYSVALPPANNVFMDDHLIYAGLLVALALLRAEDTLGLGSWWQNTAVVQKYPWLA